MRAFSLFVMIVLISVVSIGSVTAQTMGPGVSFGFFGGLAFPTGDFGSTSSIQAGGASSGFTLGGELGIPLPGGLSVLGSVAIAFNSLSEEYVKESSGSTSAISGDLGSWTTIWPMVGVRYTGTLAPTFNFYAQGQLGLLMGSTPEVNATQSGYRFSANSASGSSIGYGFGVGVIFAKIVNVGFRYSSGQPTYEYTITEFISGPGFTSTTTYNVKTDHPTSIIQLLIGVTL